MEFDTQITSKVIKGWQHSCLKGFIVFSLFNTKKVPLSSPSTFWQSLDHVQAYEFVVHQTDLAYLLKWQSKESRDCVGSIHHQYLMLWQTASWGPAWYGEREIWSFLDWRLEHGQCLAYQLPESHVRATPSGSNACLLLGCPTCIERRATLQILIVNRDGSSPF